MSGPFAPAPWVSWSGQGLAGAAAAAVVGGLIGVLLTTWGGRLLAREDQENEALPGDRFAPPPRWIVRWIEVAAVATAVALWWWEVRLLGQVPLNAGGDPAASAFSRLGAHLVLFLFLAAAAWIDIRHRVIPDAITVPGVLLGLLGAWALPDILLPVACEVPRSFAPPRLEPDVLGLCGGLRCASVPHWLGPRPHAGGLVAAFSVFAAWWLACTSAGLDAAIGGGWKPAMWLRRLLLVAGLAAIAAAWSVGGDRFSALQSSLAGMAVSGGIVWAVRAAASRALGREAMGFGDVTLMAMVGAWLGWQACVLAFFIAAFIGLAHGVFQLVAHHENELPYGPSLCLASALVVIGWRPLWSRVGVHFAEPLELVVVLVAVVALTAVALSAWRRWRHAAA